MEVTGSGSDVCRVVGALGEGEREVIDRVSVQDVLDALVAFRVHRLPQPRLHHPRCPQPRSDHTRCPTKVSWDLDEHSRKVGSGVCLWKVGGVGPGGLQA
eukprot:2458182-Rhodomonas_salina.3